MVLFDLVYRERKQNAVFLLAIVSSLGLDPYGIFLIINKNK